MNQFIAIFFVCFFTFGCATQELKKGGITVENSWDREPSSVNGKLMKVGEQTIINGMAVSCAAPLLAHGEYWTRCSYEDKAGEIFFKDLIFEARLNTASKDLVQTVENLLKEAGAVDKIVCDPIRGPRVAKKRSKNSDEERSVDPKTEVLQ